MKPPCSVEILVSFGEEHEVMGEDAEDEFAGLCVVTARGER